MNKTLNIVILGAGYGGVHAAKILNKKYKKNPNVQITLIDKNPYHTLMTELHEVAAARVDQESVQVDLKKVFNKTKVKLAIEEVQKIELKEQKLYTEYAEYSFDYLILGTGSEPAFFGVPGVKEHAFTLWSMKDALEIREHIENMFKKAAKERNEKKRQAMLTFAVAGAGFTGIEMVGELVEWKKKLAKEYNVDVAEVKLMVIEAMGRILNILDEKGAQKTEKYLTKKGVEIMINAPIVEITPDLVTLKDGTKIPTNTLIWTCGVQGNSFNKDLGLNMTNRARINTNEYMQSLDYKNVYAVGDCAFLEEGASRNLPQIVEAAEQTAATAAHNIIADIEDKEKKPFKSKYHGFMVSVGSHYAVANLNGIKMSGFIAMFMKHMVNLYYLWGVGGFYLMFKYLGHEFFNMKDRRSFVGGHLAGKSSTLWLLPLRLYMGVLWTLEGLKKLIGENTWNAASGLHKITGGMGKDSWFTAGNIKLPFTWLYDANAAASATDSASTGAAAATSAPVPILKEMPGFFSAIMKVLIPNPDVAIWFQRIVVLTELGIGLALIAGLFTWLAGAASAFLVVNFVLSAMGDWSILWYFFAGIAMMTGAGKVFGLDYFVMPWLHKRFSNFWFGKIKPVYSDK